MKRWGSFIVCLLLSACIWVVHSLSQTFSQIVDVPVLVSSDIDGHSQYCLSPIVIAAQCSGRGYDLLSLSRQEKATEVFINAKDLVALGGDSFSIPASTVMKYSDRIFGSDVKVEVVVGDYFSVIFPVENHKKVPVSLMTRVTYRKQYMLRSEITAKPDSVVVYGSPEVLEKISSIRTKAIKKIDLSGSAHGSIKLDVPAGVRVSAKTVEYDIPVSRYVNLSAQLEVGIRNKPDDKTIITVPSKVKFNMKSEFPVSENPMDNISVYVNYEDYMNSPTGRCPILCDGLAPCIIEYSITPDFCNCIEKVQ